MRSGVKRLGSLIDKRLQNKNVRKLHLTVSHFKMSVSLMANDGPVSQGDTECDDAKVSQVT